MSEINLMEKYPKSSRPIEERGTRKLSGAGKINLNRNYMDIQDIYVEHLLINKVREFGKEYFDGDRLYGYGGYYYDQRFWSETVKVFRDYYALNDGSSVLDVGCAKGFMIYDFKKLIPKLKISGLDISSYARDSAFEEIKPLIQIGNATHLPYEDKSFDLVVSINTVDHLPLEECKNAIREIQRVSRGKAFITVNAWRSEQERELLIKWNMTALTSMHVDEWKRLFNDVGYTGDYYWFIAE